MPSPMGQAPPSSPFGQLEGGPNSQPGSSPVQDDLNDLMEQIRDVGQSVDAIVGQYPSVASEGQQVKASLRAMVVKIAQAAPTQQDSGLAIPSGGM